MDLPGGRPKHHCKSSFECFLMLQCGIVRRATDPLETRPASRLCMTASFPSASLMMEACTEHKLKCGRFRGVGATS